MTKLADTQKALVRLYEFVQQYCEDAGAPYPIGDYMITPAETRAAQRAIARFGDVVDLRDRTSDCARPLPKVVALFHDPKITA
jgi:hypothetical protein